MPECYNKDVPPGSQVEVMHTRKFWPLDYDPEGEIYENLAWDLPGFRRRRKTGVPPGSVEKPEKNSGRR